MKVHLTEAAINKRAREAATTQRRVDLSDEGHPGLRLRLTPGGGKSWVLAMRDREGRFRRFPLGSYPTIGIAAARERARDLRQAIRTDGAPDPIEARRQVRDVAAAAARGEGTLRAVLDLYGAGPGASLRSWPHSRLRIERVFATLVDKPAVYLTAPSLLLAADAYRAQASAAFAIRTLRPVLKWAAARGLVPASVTSIQRRDPIRRRSRVLSRDELARILPVLTASTRPHAAALRLMLLTLARREEVCAATWAEVDLAGGTWSIPAERSKNGQPHVVPLSRQAEELLRAARAGTFAAKPKARKGAELEPAAPPQATASDLVFATIAGTVLGNWDRETKAVQIASSTKDWHRHDLRRTGATMLGDMGELPDIIEAALNHVAIRSPLAANYNRSRYRPQVAAALQRLADALDGIARGGAEVVSISRAVA